MKKLWRKAFSKSFPVSEVELANREGKLLLSVRLGSIGTKGAWYGMTLLPSEEDKLLLALLARYAARQLESSPKGSEDHPNRT